MDLKNLLNQKVIIRTLNSDVHFGTLVEHEVTVAGVGVRLTNARRFWNYDNSISLAEVAKTGTDENFKYSEDVAEIVIYSCLEIIPLTSNLKDATTITK